MEGVAPPFAAVLFDLDGVLRNTEPYHRMAYAQLARSLVRGRAPDAGEIAGKSNLQLYEALVARFGGRPRRRSCPSGTSGWSASCWRSTGWGRCPAWRRPWTPCAARGIPFGVVSSSWRWYVEHCLRELGMYEDAAVIVTGSDGLPLKPAPAPYQAAARVFRPAPPGAVLAVEDSGSGVRSAVAAGLACAAVYNPDSGAQDLSPARWRLNSLYELPALLDGN